MVPHYEFHIYDLPFPLSFCVKSTSFLRPPPVRGIEMYLKLLLVSLFLSFFLLMKGLIKSKFI